MAPPAFSQTIIGFVKSWQQTTDMVCGPEKLVPLLAEAAKTFAEVLEAGDRTEIQFIRSFLVSKEGMPAWYARAGNWFDRLGWTQQEYLSTLKSFLGAFLQLSEGGVAPDVAFVIKTQERAEATFKQLLRPREPQPNLIDYEVWRPIVLAYHALAIPLPGSSTLRRMVERDMYMRGLQEAPPPRDVTLLPYIATPPKDAPSP